MNRLLTLALLLVSFLFSLTNPASAGEKAAPLHYQGEIAGVVCSACGKKVQAALGKLPGVKSVKIVPGKESGRVTVNVISTRAGLTKEDAVKALGDDATSYAVVSFAEKKP